MPGLPPGSGSQMLQNMLADPKVQSGLSPESLAAIQNAAQQYAGQNIPIETLVQQLSKDPAFQSAMAEAHQKGVLGSWIDKWGPVVGLGIIGALTAGTALIPAAAAEGTAGGGATAGGSTISGLLPATSDLPGGALATTGALPAGSAGGNIAAGIAADGSSIAGGGSTIGSLLGNGNALQTAGSLLGKFAGAEAANRGTTGNLTQGYDKLNLASQQDQRAEETDALRKLYATNYLQNGGFNAAKSSPLPTIGIQPLPASQDQIQGAGTLAPQLLNRLTPGGTWKPTDPNSYLKPGTAENVANYGSLITGVLGGLGKGGVFNQNSGNI